jgi:hypothetical protein
MSSFGQAGAQLYLILCEHDRLAAIIEAMYFASNLSDFLPEATSNHTPLLERLTTIRQRKSTDPRDKVFAALGLVPPRAQELLNIDYDPGVPQLYTKVAVLMLNFRNRLGFLSVCQPASPRLDIPSWVPDWSDTRTQAHSFIGMTKLALFTARGEMQLQAQADAAYMKLKMKGKMWDTITFAFRWPKLRVIQALLYFSYVSSFS